MIRIVEWLAARLSPGERDAVLGDLAEAGATDRETMHALLGLFARRLLSVCAEWRTWTSLAGLISLGVLLALASRVAAGSTSVPLWLYLNNWTTEYLASTGARADLFDNGTDVFRQFLLLVCWSWASGLILGSLSRRTIRVDGILFCLVVLLMPGWQHPHPGGSNDAVYSRQFYSIIFPVMLQAVLVFVPAIAGMRQGPRMAVLPFHFRWILWISIVATIGTLAIRNWGFILCDAGQRRACAEWVLDEGYAHILGRPENWQIPALPLSLAGPAAYIAAMAFWQRRLRTVDRLPQRP